MSKDNLWLTSFQSRKNQIISVRYIQAEDTENFINIFEHMSEKSRYQRFNQTQDNLTSKKIWEEATGMIDVTLSHGGGLIAFADLQGELDVPVAVVRYVNLDAETAEVAMSVRDDMQGHGLGTTLFKMLLEEAKKNGVKKLVGMLQNNNTAMWVVFDRIPYPLKRIPDGTVSDIEIDLTRSKPLQSLFQEKKNS